MPASTLDTLVSIADQRARRGQSDLDQHREKAARARLRYQRLVAYANDYRRAAPDAAVSGELQSRQTFLMRIDSHVATLAQELDAMEKGGEILRDAARDDRSCAHALQALQARTEEAAIRRTNRRESIQLVDTLAARASRYGNRSRVRGAW